MDAAATIVIIQTSFEDLEVKAARGESISFAEMTILKERILSVVAAKG